MYGVCAFSSLSFLRNADWIGPEKHFSSQGEVFMLDTCALKRAQVSSMQVTTLFILSLLHCLRCTILWFTSQHCYTMYYNYNQSTRLTRLENGCNNQLFFYTIWRLSNISSFSTWYWWCVWYFTLQPTLCYSISTWSTAHASINTCFTTHARKPSFNSSFPFPSHAEPQKVV